MQHKCYKCYIDFHTKEDMTNHMKHQHPIFISCKECEQTLKESSEIEEHT